MRANILIHLEPDDKGLPTWWAESKELEGFTAVAASLSELRELIHEELTIISEETGDRVVYGDELLVRDENASSSYDRGNSQTYGERGAPASDSAQQANLRVVTVSNAA